MGTDRCNMGKMNRNVAESRPDAEELTSLLQKVHDGDDGAFTRLVVRYEGLLHTQAAHFGEASGETEDAYQEACLALHRAALRYEAGKEVTFGLFAKICIANALKSKISRSKAPETVPLEEEDLFADFSDPMVEEEKLNELLGVIHSLLSPYEAEVFDLYAEDVPVPEIAARIGEDEKSVRNALSRAIGKLRKKLGR